MPIKPSFKPPKKVPRTTAPKVRESTIQNAILSLLALRYPRALIWRNHIGGVPNKNGTYRPAGRGRFSAVGTSDILMLIDGVFFAFEVKRSEKEKPSDKQLEFIEHVRRMGGCAHVVWDLKQVAEIVDTALKKN